MSGFGKKHRLKRFLYPDTNTGLIVPMDHGLTMGPLLGMERLSRVYDWLSHPAICGVIVHKGIAERLLEAHALPHQGLMIHLNGMSNLAPSPDRKIRLTSMETAVQLGADGVSLQINFEGGNDADNLHQLGTIVDEASRFGLPVLAMIYDKSKDLPTPLKNKRMRHLIRIAIELGTDAVKIAIPESLFETQEILEGLSEDILIFFAGGATHSPQQLAAFASQATQLGAAGLCAGRTIFQSDQTVMTLEVLKESILSSTASQTLRRRKVEVNALH